MAFIGTRIPFAPGFEPTKQIAHHSSPRARSWPHGPCCSCARHEGIRGSWPVCAWDPSKKRPCLQQTAGRLFTWHMASPDAQARFWPKTRLHQVGPSWIKGGNLVVFDTLTHRCDSVDVMDPPPLASLVDWGSRGRRCWLLQCVSSDASLCRLPGVLRLACWITYGYRQRGICRSCMDVLSTRPEHRTAPTLQRSSFISPAAPPTK